MKRTLLFVLTLCACSPRVVGIGETEFGLKVCAKGSTIEGVDVSHYDGAIDWAKVHGAGIDFAFMKATEGLTFTDPTFATNFAGAQQHGVVRGGYHFFHSNVDPVAQADHFLAVNGMPQPGDLPPTLDLEVNDGQSGTVVAQTALAWLQHIETQTGVTPIVYTSASFLTGSSVPTAGFDRYTLWVPNWQVTCPNIPSPPWSDWVFWQYTDSGTVAGIAAAAVDRNQFNGTLADLMSFVGRPMTLPDLGGARTDLSTAPSPDLTAPAIDLASASDSSVLRDLSVSAAAPDQSVTGGGGASTSGCNCSCSVGPRRAPLSFWGIVLLLGMALVRRQLARSRTRVASRD